MFTNSIIAATGALLTMVAAVPMADQHHHHHPAHKRDYVWVTHTEVAVETIPVTKTVWIEPGETPPTKHKKPNKYGSSSSSSSSPAPAAYTPPAPASPSTSSSSTPAPNAYSPPAVPTTSTSVYVAPAPTTSTSVYVAPAPTTSTSTYVAPTTNAAPTSSAAPVSSSGSSSGSSVSGLAAAGTYRTGDLTWYDVGLGACGWTNTANEAIVAIPEAIFDAYNPGNPNNNPLCGKYVTITGKDGSPYKAKIVDRCPGCTVDDLDLSQDFFNTVTQNGDGRVHGMKWCFD